MTEAEFKALMDGFMEGLAERDFGEPLRLSSFLPRDRAAKALAAARAELQARAFT